MMISVGMYRVAGMTCEGCVRALSSALRRANANTFVQVDLPPGTLSAGGIESDDAVRRAAERAGFDYRGAVPAH